GVRQDVTQFPSLMNRAGSFGCAVAADSAGKRKIFEEAQQSFFVLAFVRIDFRVGAFQVNRRQNAWSTMSGASHEDHVQIERFNDAVQVAIYKGQRWAGAPMPEQAVLDVFGLQGLAQEWVGLKVNHSECDVVAGRPEGVNFPRFFVVQ